MPTLNIVRILIVSGEGGGEEGVSGVGDDELMLNVLRCHLTY